MMELEEIAVGEYVELRKIEQLLGWVGRCVGRNGSSARIIWYNRHINYRSNDVETIPDEALRRICLTFAGWRWLDGD